MNLLSTFKGSMMEGFLPQGWDLARIDACCSHPPEAVTERQAWWHPGFQPVPCASVADLNRSYIDLPADWLDPTVATAPGNWAR